MRQHQFWDWGRVREILVGHSEGTVFRFRDINNKDLVSVTWYSWIEHTTPSQHNVRYWLSYVTMTYNSPIFCRAMVLCCLAPRLRCWHYTKTNFCPHNLASLCRIYSLSVYTAMLFPLNIPSCKYISRGSTFYISYILFTRIYLPPV